jgi:hypothetical protein
MGGGLMQLVAYGAQDIYLTGNPQITFFKVVYRRHTNFSMESIQQTWNGAVAQGGRVSATISRNGDLVGRMYFQLDAGFIDGTNSANPGAALFNKIELEIGGQLIDRHYGHWLEVFAELTEPNNSRKSATQGVGAANEAVGTPFQLMSMMGGVLGAGAASDVVHYVPLQFWFCRNPGLALPLIALQYHEVKVTTTFNSTTDGTVISGTGCNLWVDYIYLDTDERRRFAQVSHEYLIEQVQHQSVSADASAVQETLNFNHPVKEIIWAGSNVGESKSATVSFATPLAITAGSTWRLTLNGHDRFATRPLTYFTRCQVWQHHTGPGGSFPTATHNVCNDSICVYSFALKPEEHQPSGTCNFSRIDNAQLINTGTACAVGLNIYAVNYNVLRIMSGMGGLAYSN